MSNAFNARLHGEHLPSAGVLVVARFVGNRLHVEGEPPQQIDGVHLSVVAGGLNEETPFLIWTHAQGRCSLTPAEKVDRAALLATAPPVLAAELARFAKRSRRLNTMGLLLGGLAMSLLLAVFAVIWGYGRTLDWVAKQVPIEVETTLGKAAVAEFRNGNRLIEHGPAVDALAVIGTKLTAGSRYQYHWTVLDEKSINAFAAPGGYVVVHRGLIEAAKTPEELAAVLAHEVQHIEQRHTLKAMINGLGVATLVTIVLGDVSAVAGVLAYQVGTMSYSRDLESEADRLGLAALVRADISPAGMATFFRTLENEAAATPIALLSSHPATEARIASIEAGIAALPARTYPPLAVNWAAVQGSFQTDPAYEASSKN